MLRMITAAAMGLAALLAVPSVAGAQRVERQTTVVTRGPHGNERVVTRTTVRQSSYRRSDRRSYGRPGYRRPAYGRPAYGYGRPGSGRPGYGRAAYGNRRHCWNSWYHGRPIRRCN